MAPCAAFGENVFAVRHKSFVLAQRFLGVRIDLAQVFQVMRRSALQKEKRHGWRLRFGRCEVSGILTGNGNRNWRNGLPANQGVKVQQPLFTESTDVHVNAVESAESADGIGTVLQHARSPNRARYLVIFRERTFLDVLVE